MKSYSAYKPSGIDWLGNLPAHWNTRRLKTILTERVEKGFPDEPLLAATQAKGVVRKEQYENRTVLALKDLHLLKLVDVGDFVISLRSFQGGIEYAYERGIISPAYTVLSPISRSVSGYLTRLFKSKPFISNLSLHVTGIREGQNIDYGRLRTSYVPVPPLDEQAAIAHYLDRADYRIRRAISVKERLIELLTEQRQAVIHRAVTRGLDPNVRLKDSGAEWLGDVPAHWRKVRLKALLTRPLQNGLFKKKDQFGSGAPLINVADIYQEDFRVEASELEHVQVDPDEARRFQVQDGDVFFVRSSLKLEGTGRSAVAVNCSPDTVFECHLVGARPNRRLINPRFMAFQLNALAFREYLVSQANMVTMATIDQGTIACSALVIPPRSEQDKIVEWLDTRWEEITLAIDKAQRQIDLLREYRTRLIADVVTGQVDVREQNRLM